MPEVKISGLSISQEKAARLIVNSNKISDKEVAEAVGIKKSMLAEWKRLAQFKLRVLQLMDANIDLERAYRVKYVGKYLKPIYKQIRKKLKDKDNLKMYPLKDLVRMMTVLHNELRLDGNFNRRFLEAGMKDYGEDIPHKDEYDEEVDMTNVSDLYEERRKRELSKK